MRLSDSIIADIELRQARAVSKPAFEEFRSQLAANTDSLTRPPRPS